MSGITLDELESVAIISTGGNELAIDGSGFITANINGDVNVTATDLDIRDLDASQDNVAISDGTDVLAINADGSLNAVVSATDLDIRDLVNTQDSMAIGDETNLVDLEISDAAFVGGYGFSMYGLRQDASGSPVSADGDAHPLVFNNDGELKVAADLTSDIADDAADAGNPIKVGGRGVSGALTALSASGDRYDLLGDLYRRTWVNTSRNIGLANSAASVTTTAAEVLASPLSGRREVTIQNEGNSAVYLGSSASVTSANGVKISKNSSATFEFGEDIDIFMIADSGSQDVRFLEAA